MAKKGASNSGSGAGRQKQKDQERAKQLPPSPASWRHRPQDWPYHNNLGTKHRKPSGALSEK